MADNIFLKPAEFYKRQINPLGQYVEQTGFYLSKMTGKDIEACKQFVSSGIKNKQFQGVNDPVVKYYERGDNGDKFPAEIRLSNYINSVNSNNEILVPTFTTYVSADIKQSLLVEFIDANVKRRSVAKKAAFKAKAEGNKDLHIMKDNEQTNMKLYNNSMSGAFATEGSVLNNPTGHNTLTSITRSVSSLGNASNEKIISGNRHYRNPDVTLYNLISITSSLDRENLRAVMDKYKLKYPTIEDVVECVQYSSDLYWLDGKAFEKIQNYINTLDDLERAAVVYIGDLFHIRKHNEIFVRNFLTGLSTRIGTDYIPDALEVLKKIDEQVVNYVHQVYLTETKGIGKDYSKLPKEQLHWLVATCLHIVEVVTDYKDFINVIFLSNNVPASTAYIPSMIRRSVVLSDTDSTMFSVDEWVIWYFGKLKFDNEAFALAGAVMLIATQSIAHTLAILSANMNVKREKLFLLAMKPEFVFSVFAQTSVAKHYYTCIIAKEGNVYKEPEMEIKGVYLKNSAAPKVLIKAAQAKMKEILVKIMNSEKISIVAELKEVADIERRITNSLLNGEVEFYKQSKIKTPEAYAREQHQSPYLYHILWQDVFEAKYGAVDMPAYSVIKIPTTIDNPTALKDWLGSIADRELADRLDMWTKTYNKKNLPTIYISLSYILSNKIPVEIKSVINVKKIVLDLTMTNRMILESLGYFPKSELLISEQGY